MENEEITDTDRLNIHAWAIARAIILRKDINAYITSGVEKSEAVKRVLDKSNIGAGYKSQIRYEFK